MLKKIILADDHELLLQGLKNVLAEIEDVEIVATATNGLELLDLAHHHKPFLIVLDLNMPGADGFKCIQKIKQSLPFIKLVVLTNYNQHELIDDVKKLGADGFIAKNTSSAELKSAILAVLNGEQYFELENITTIDQDDYFYDDFLKKYHLTRREVNIIQLICAEMSSKEIASKLVLSEFTINTHRKNIMKKLDVKNVAGIINFAKEHKLV